MFMGQGATDEAGWGFSGEYTEAEANAATPDNLRTNAVFRQNPTKMFSTNIEYNAVNSLLAKGIPALSPPIGINAVNALITSSGNKNINITQFKVNGWGRSGGDYDTRWLHSDFRDMGYFYTSGMYDDIVIKGGLK